MALDRRRVLLTGAGGFVGRHLAKALTQDGVFDLVAPAGPGVAGGLDLADESAVQHLLAVARPAVVVHLAAASSVGSGAGDPEGVWRNNFDATRSLARAIRSTGRPALLVFASSAEVYGASFNRGPCDEASPMDPTSVYGRTKAACELMLRDLATRDFRVVALRLFNHTGPGQDARFVAPTLAAQIAALGRTPDGAGQPGRISVGNLEARRDFSDVRDIVEAYRAVISADLSDAPPMSVYNVGSGETRSIQSLLDTLTRLHGADVRAVQDPARLRPSDIPVAQGVVEAFQSRFGWQAARPFDQTLADLLDHEARRLDAGA